MKNRNDINYKKMIFLFLVGGSSLIAWAYIFLKNPEAIHQYFVDDNFGDFFGPIRKTRLETYTVFQSNYPPLVNAFFLTLKRIAIKQEFIRDTGLGLFLLIFILFSVGACWEINKKILTSGNTLLNRLCVLVLLSSGPFLFLFSRANNVLIVLPLISFFVVYYNSENKYLKEVALISLALATAIKIYPVVFFVLLISKENWKSCIREAIYMIVFFFAPFLIYGKGSILNFINNLMFREGEGVYKLNHAISVPAGVQFGYGIFTNKIILSNLNIVKIAALLILVYIYLFTKVKWQKIYAVSLFSIWVFNGSYLYNICYLSIPILFFLNEDKNYKMDIIYTILFAAMFTLTFLPYIDGLNSVLAEYDMGIVSYSIVIPNFALMLSVIVMLIETIIIQTRRSIRIKKGDTNEGFDKA